MNFKLIRTFHSKVFLCVFSLFLAVLIVFFIYVSKTQKTGEYKSMENYNENIIFSINSNFSMLHENVCNMVARVFALPSTTRAIYQKNIDDNQHITDYEVIMKELKAIPSFHSAVIYNNKTETFDYLWCDETEMRNITNNILDGGKNTAAFQPYINMIASKEKTEYIITYYAYDFLDSNTMNGAIAVNIQLDWFNYTISALNVNDMNIILCDSSGNILFDYKQLYRYQQPIDYDKYSIMEQDNVGKGGMAIKHGGKRYFVNVEELPHTNYFIICLSEYKLFSLPRIGQIFIDIVAFLFLLAMGIILSRRISQHVSAPVENLKNHMQNELGINLVDDDIFKCISDIVDRSVNDTLLMTEMKNFVNNVRQQEHLKMLMRGEPEAMAEAGVHSELAEFYGESPIVGVELLFKGSIESDKVNSICQAVFEGTYKFAAIEHNVFMLIIKNNTANTSQMNTVMEALQDKFASSVNQRPSIFVSSVYGFEQISEVYNEIRMISRYELLYGSGCILDCEIISEGDAETDNVYPKEEENRILKAIINKNIEATEHLFDDFLQKIIIMNVNDFKMYLIRLSFGILGLHANEASRNDGSYEKIMGIIKQVESLNNMSEVCECFTKLFTVCCSESGDRDKKKANSSMVKHVIDCIEQDYAKPDLNLDIIAERLNLSPNYIGKRFKEEMGISISKYLKEYRLQKSIEFLNNPNLDIKSIIGKVGFVSESNFYKQFKEYYLMTPNDYRKANIS